MTDDRVSILLVDDRQENLLALDAILEPLGQVLIRAGSGPEALRQVLATDFAVMLLDVQMPGMNGFEVAEIIKSRERSRTIPIIFLSAISKEDAYVFKGYSMGAVDYVFKPFNPDVLRSKVAVFVDLFLKQRELQQQGDLLRESQKRELELEHRTSLLEAEARSAAKLSQMNDELHRRQVALEQAMGARNRFYASMSHELRTPINAVIGYSTIMLDNIYGPLNAKQKEGLQRSLKAARHLLELVNDVLDLSKIEAGKMLVQHETIDLQALIRDVSNEMRPLVAKKGNTLIIHSERGLGTAWSDPTRIRQILTNLLSNANRFTDGGRITLSAGFGTGEEGDWIEFAVADTGVGISKQQAEHIFQPFTQGHSMRLGEEGTTGLGLVLCKRFCALLGGDIGLESELGEGATFRVKLPRRASDRRNASGKDRRQAGRRDAPPGPIDSDTASQFDIERAARLQHR
jgi:signal transduction histidine kinase